MKSTDELSLWERARQGDPDAFGAVFDLHQARVYRQARRLTATPEDAEDVTALAFLEAWRRRGTVRVIDGSIIAWLTVTVTHLSRNAARARRRNRALLAKLHDWEGAPQSADHTGEVAERLDRAHLAEQAQVVLARLPQRDRDVIALCVIQELSTSEAAAVLNVAPGTVKSRLFRARQRLSSEMLAGLAPDPLKSARSAGGSTTTGGAR